MSILIAIIILGLLGLVILIVSAPLRSGPAKPGAEAVGAGPEAAGVAASRRLELDELEAEREAKYREIRDCELDYRTGKLSLEDYEAIDAQLRAEAIGILNRLERAGREGADGAARPRDA